MSEKKYVLLKRKKVVHGNVYYQIKAVKTFETIDGEMIEAGTLGGFIQAESCLSQDGRCWIDKYSHVMAGLVHTKDLVNMTSILPNTKIVCRRFLRTSNRLSCVI